MQVGKKKVGLFLPLPLADALDDFTATVGKKQKWLVVGAALIRFLQSEQSIQHDLIRQVKIADLPGGSFDQLIASARELGGAHSTPTRSPEFQQLVGIDDARGRTNAASSDQRTRKAKQKRQDRR